jgi:hypothetical protein
LFDCESQYYDIIKISACVLRAHTLVLRRVIIAKYVAVRSLYGIILPQMGQTRDEALEE